MDREETTVDLEIDVELRDIDEKILEYLAEERCTRQYLAEELGVTGEYIYKRVDLLHKLQLVDIIHEGFYTHSGYQRVPLTAETGDRLTERKDTDESYDTVIHRLLSESGSEKTRNES